MKKVEITYEKTMRVAVEREVTDEELEMLLMGDNPFVEELEKELENGDVTYDYTVNDEQGRTLVDWN